MKKQKWKIGLLIGLITLSSFLTGCQLLNNELGKLKEAIKGRPMVINTYDENSQIIDQINGKSVSVSADDKFATKNSDGSTVEKSSVISFTVGGKSMVHVGSSLVMHEQGLKNVFEEYAKKVNVENFDRSTPFVNRMVNDMKNLTTGKSKVILIRSQTGKPLATFVGNKVSYFATDIDKSTGILIDGKYLFIYRCDYTIYDADLLK